MAADESFSLSSELEELITDFYPPLHQSHVRNVLLSYGLIAARTEADRVQFDLLHLGGGDAEKVERLAQVAARDPRDVMSREYFRRAGRSYPHPWARRHVVNRDWADPPQIEDPLCTAQLFVRSPARASNGTKPLRVPSLTFAFHSDVSLLNFADQLLSLSEPGRMIDLSNALEFKGQTVPESTVIRCLFGGEYDTLIYDGKVLSWNGDVDYWIECRSQCLRLKEAGIGFQDMAVQTASDQRIRLSLCEDARS